MMHLIQSFDVYYLQNHSGHGQNVRNLSIHLRWSMFYFEQSHSIMPYGTQNYRIDSLRRTVYRFDQVYDKNDNDIQVRMKNRKENIVDNERG